MTSKTMILSEFIADFIVQFRIQELQNISHKQPLKLSKLDSIFLDILFNLSNVWCDPRKWWRVTLSGHTTVKLTAGLRRVHALVGII